MHKEHDFHSREYVESWAETVNERRPQRAVVFDHIAELISTLAHPKPHVVELAPGPGMLAEVLLTKLPEMSYEAVDFSRPMLKLAEERLVNFKDRTQFHCADLLKPGWTSLLEKDVQAFVSMQALHDLRSDRAIADVYRAARQHLSGGGMLVNADLIAGGEKPKASNTEESNTGKSNPGRLTVSRHLKLLKEAGFIEARCSLDFGDYACVVAKTPMRKA